MKTLIHALALAATGTIFASQAHAQDEAIAAAETVENDGYERFVAALSPDGLHEKSYATTVNQLREYYLDDTNFVLLEKQCPGMIDTLLQDTDGMLREYHWAEAEAIRKLILETAHEHLTEEQAASAADVYLSPIGQKMIMAAGDNVSVRNTFDEAAYGDGEEIERGAYDRDQMATVSKTLRALTQEEIVEFGGMVAAADWYPAFLEMNPVLQQGRYEILNAELIPGYQDRLNAAMEKSMTDHLASCE